MTEHNTRTHGRRHRRRIRRNDRGQPSAAARRRRHHAGQPAPAVRRTDPAAPARRRHRRRHGRLRHAARRWHPAGRRQRHPHRHRCPHRASWRRVARRCDYDYVIYAVGSTGATPASVPGAAEFAYPDRAIRVRRSGCATALDELPPRGSGHRRRRRTDRRRDGRRARRAGPHGHAGLRRQLGAVAVASRAAGRSPSGCAKHRRRRCSRTDVVTEVRAGRGRLRRRRGACPAR